MNIKRQNLLPNRAIFSVQTLSMARALDTVVYSSHAAGAELEREGLASAGDGVADGQTGGLLVHLDGRAVLLKTDDLTDKVAIAILYSSLPRL